MTMTDKSPHSEWGHIFEVTMYGVVVGVIVTLTLSYFHYGEPPELIPYMMSAWLAGSFVLGRVSKR